MGELECSGCPVLGITQKSSPRAMPLAPPVLRPPTRGPKGGVRPRLGLTASHAEKWRLPSPQNTPTDCRLFQMLVSEPFMATSKDISTNWTQSPALNVANRSSNLCRGMSRPRARSRNLSLPNLLQTDLERPCECPFHEPWDRLHDQCSDLENAFQINHVQTGKSSG